MNPSGPEVETALKQPILLQVAFDAPVTEFATAVLTGAQLRWSQITSHASWN